MALVVRTCSTRGILYEKIFPALTESKIMFPMNTNGRDDRAKLRFGDRGRW